MNRRIPARRWARLIPLSTRGVRLVPLSARGARRVPLSARGAARLIPFSPRGAGRLILPAVMALALFLIAGCSGPRVFLHPEADLSFYQKVGVIPFLAGAGDQAAALAATGSFTTELLIGGGYEVVEPGNFMMRAAQFAGGTDLLKTQPMNSDQIKSLADSTGVQAVFAGQLRSYEMVRVGQGNYPLVSIEVRMIDAETGKLLWMGSETRRGGPGFPILGWGETPTLSELLLKVCKDVAGEVPR